MLVLYFLLLLIALPAWFWLCIRIAKVHPTGAKLSFFLFLPGLYFAYTLRDDPVAQIRPAAFANLALFILTLLIGFQLPDDWAQAIIQGSARTQKLKHSAEKKRVNSEMERWCREKNDAAYDPELDTCVERNKAEALALDIDKAAFIRLAAYLEKNGIQGELDRSTSATSIKLARSAEIAAVATYYFLPFSMSQSQLLIYLCVSETACASYVENTKDHSPVSLIRNRHLLLSVPPDALENPRVKLLIDVFMGFKAG